MANDSSNWGPENEAAVLKPRQVVAARELAKGKRVEETTKVAGVSRATLYRWMREPHFMAWLNRWKAMAAEIAQNQLYAGVSDAAACLVAAARDNYRAADLLLRRVEKSPPGSGDAGIVAQQLELAKRVDRAYLDRRNAVLDDFEADTATGNFGETDAEDEDEDELDGPEENETDESLRQRIIEELKARGAAAAESPPGEQQPFPPAPSGFMPPMMGGPADGLVLPEQIDQGRHETF